MVKVNVIGLKEFENKIKKAPQQLRKEVGAEVRAAAMEWRELAVKDAPKDVSTLSKGIKEKEITDLQWTVTSNSEYSAPMEFGTKGKFTPIPGVDMSDIKWPKGGDYYDFLNNILNWVKRKGIGGKYRGSIAPGSVTLSRKKQDQLVKTAEAIAWSILKKGVTPHPFFFHQFPIVQKNLIDRIKAKL